MGNWKELGVVPDSDEEDWDAEDELQQPLLTDNSPPSPQSQSPPHPTQQPAPETRNDDVWDFPSSSASPPRIENHLQAPQIPNVDPPSSALSGLGNHASQSLGQQSSAAPPNLQCDQDTVDRGQASPQPPTDVSAEPGAYGKSLDRRDHTPLGTVRGATPSEDPVAEKYMKSPSEVASLEHRHEKESDNLVETGANAESAQTRPPIASESPVRGRRSLRPRKPIQEHPYLLENAQYSKAFKSHGLKPIRIAVAEQASVRRRHGEDSQDTEYAGDASQSGGPDEESQNPPNTTTRKVLDDDLDELALSQSPKTSSPQRHLRASCDQSPAQHTDDTSLHDDDEFPDLRNLTSARTKKSTKRRPPPEPWASRKRLRTTPAVCQRNSSLHTDAWELPTSPEPLTPTSRIMDMFSTDDSPRPSFRRRTASRSTSPPGLPKSSPTTHGITDPMELAALLADSDEEQASDSSSSDGESDLIRQTGRRIRGVLPASWLRLDQQTRKGKAKSSMRKPSPPRSPGQPRQGLASTRIGTSKPQKSARSFLDELNEEDEEEIQQISEYATLDQIYDQDLGGVSNFNLDDNASLVEEDVIDHMLPDKKRHRFASAGPPRKRAKTKQKIFTGQTRYRQLDISESVHRQSRPSSNALKRRPKERTGRQADRAFSPPALSIVDFIEPSAPKFIKVAARAARMRKDMGRSMPSYKTINLGNRADNLDALMVLQNWKFGKIKQRAPKAQLSTQQRPARPRRPPQPVTSKPRRPAKLAGGLSFHRPEKVNIQVSMADFVSVKETEPPSDRPLAAKQKNRKLKPRPRDHELGYRPAQLETEVLQGDDNVVFGARKKMLDLVFRKSRKEILAPNFALRRSSPETEPQTGSSDAQSKQANSGVSLGRHGDSPPRKVTLSRLRKRIAPKRLNVDAPQYLHANAPLPFLGGPPASAEEEVQPHGLDSRKLSGLGPFGTHYTQDFDVFPLHRDTFFHHDTIIGNGTLKRALHYQKTAATTSDGPVLSFTYADHQFQWGPWDDTSSSELGLLFDAIVEDVEENKAGQSLPATTRAVDGAGNVLIYVLDFVSVKDEFELQSFTQRILELLDWFINQPIHSTSDQESSKLLVQITTRLLVCALVILRLCQGSVNLLNEAQEAEDVLKRLAKVGMQKLLGMGMSEVRTGCDDLQRLGIRERGIRADSVTMTSWVVVIKVLESAQIPRNGFWDLVSLNVAADLAHVNDAQILESLWRDMFTLLPLAEFDDAGLISQGQRHVAPLQGWTLPQKLLRVVFESYQGNQRQSPSFNGYCRALLGRCHCLIEQWGWYKCVGVIGTVFDFFGGHNLSHLRNEEVYDSPQFLANLSNGPCLSVEPSDRCFHIFLKMLAVAIRKMNCRGAANDIRNLIARCLPNHDRQYSKELAIHSHDLASLRNHHDLLCTLFWAPPPAFRRPVELIERLVQPATSHKEACLINLRAWSQLARFVVSSGSSIQDYRPFMSWQNNVFQQVLNQFLLAATDVEQQFMSMAKEERNKLQQDFLDRVVAANQSAAKDVLRFSVIASLDVMKHCPSLTSAMFSFNVNQMTKVFSKLSSKGPDLDWRILRDCVDTVDEFVKRIEELGTRLRESSCDSVSTSSSRELEDAIHFLDDKIIQSFMTAVRKAMASPASDVVGQSASTVVEKAIILCGRIASLFVDGGTCSLLHFFSAGKFSLFGALPNKLCPAEWKFVPLFVATLLRNYVFNFSTIGCTHLDLWTFCLVKPSHALRYEMDLADSLKALGLRYMDDTVITTGTALNYDKNRGLFANVISHMRRELRQVDFLQKKPTRSKYEKLLRATMQQMKSDIKSLKLNSEEHLTYISFVREIVGLIKSHGVDICAVDPYFFQVSAEYSPPREDPEMHTAQILAYGVKLGEGETTAIPQLFFYLYSHFKTCLSSGELNAESKIIENGMKDDNILVFVIGRMLPAIIRASLHSDAMWPLLGTYSKALQNGLARSCVPREIPEESVDDVVALLTAVLDWTRSLGESSNVFTGNQAQIFTDLVGACNAVRPSLASWMQQTSITATTSRLRGCVAVFTRLAKQAATVLERLRCSGGSHIGVRVRDVPVKDLVRSQERHESISFDNHVNNFTQTLIREVQNSWVVTPDTITVRIAATPSTQKGTQAMQGVNNNLDSKVGLLSELLGGLTAWVVEMGEEEQEAGRRKGRRRPRRAPLSLAIEPF